MHNVTNRDLAIWYGWLHREKQADLARTYGISDSRVFQIINRISRLSVWAMRNHPKIRIKQDA